MKNKGVNNMSNNKTDNIKRPMEDKHRKYLKILTECKGIITMACNKANINRSCHYDWIDDIEGFKEAVEDATEAAIDHVESKLYNLIDANDTTATIFYLKTKAKKRGYVERQETEISGSLSVSIEDQLLELVEDDDK